MNAQPQITAFAETAVSRWIATSETLDEPWVADVWAEEGGNPDSAVDALYRAASIDGTPIYWADADQITNRLTGVIINRERVISRATLERSIPRFVKRMDDALGELAAEAA